MAKQNIFNEIDNIKLRAEEEILKNQNLLKLLSIGHDDPLSKPDITSVSKLVDKYVFFKPKVFDDTVTETQSFLLTDIRITPIRGGSGFCGIDLIFTIIVHNDLFELFDGKTRSYQIANELTESFNNEYGTWLGKCKLETCYSIEVPSSYQGIRLIFTMTDFK